jgi:hypothetical protein
MKIAVEIQRMTKAGVATNVIFDKVKEMPNGPRSLTTFYKIYRGDLVQARATLHEAVGSLIMEKAIVEKDYRALEFVAKTKMGWNEKVIVEERDPGEVDQDTSAVDDLIAALNLKKKQ